MTNYARQERALLADLLLSEGPDAPTLCEGWTTRDLAAHLVVRERRPDASAGILIKPLASYGEKIRAARAGLPYGDLIEQLRNPPSWGLMTNPVVDPLANTVEFFIHHEDVRRAAPGWEPRTLTPDFEAAIWRNVKLISRASLRRIGIAAEIVPSGLPPITVGEDPQVKILGDAGELAVFFFGRQRAARVTVEGDPAVADRLRNAKLGV
ncbi:TIGR03085 family protein [Actinoplanes sp. OR16]|uniref:TIGR03085 family metal-binding protein n=1 Tax=Actinoplanes sp. OR16 TaxID=946334 RepID=UPI000F70DE52|nr:TIGR03085 family metal-binding protein [Actinoplanes sp. OR16]BBH66985.1 TIGR03085 family protein [Actinoplanes sp. OR16]